MTHRSILAGQAPTVVVRANGTVTVEGWDNDRVQAESDNSRGVQIEKRKVTDIGRERALAKLGERVLFDISINNPFKRARRDLKDVQGEAIQVQLDSSGQVRVPLKSHLILYAGRSAEVRHVKGRVTATTGHDLSVQDVQVLVHAAAGGDLDIDCATLGGDEFKFSAGRDLRFHARELNDATVLINEAGTYWEVVLGSGRLKVRLNAGGDVTLVTDQDVKAQPPHYLLGNIERPASVPETTKQD